MFKFFGLQRDIAVDFEPSGGLELDKTLKEEKTEKEGFNYPLPFEEWCKEFKVSSKFTRDVTTESAIKVLIIKNAQLYNRCNQNKYIS